MTSLRTIGTLALALIACVGCKGAPASTPKSAAAAAHVAAGSESEQPRCYGLATKLTDDASPAAVALAAERCGKEEAEGGATAAFLLAVLVRQHPELTGYGTFEQHLEQAVAGGHIVAKAHLAQELLAKEDRSEATTTRALALLHEAYCADVPFASEETYARLGVAPPTCPPDPLQTLIGSWEGEVTVDGADAPASLRGRKHELRIELTAGDVRVFMRMAEEAWRELKEGSFQLSWFAGNFVLISHSDGWDPDGRWVETFVLTGTVHDADSLRVNVVRTVSNLQVPRDHKSASFSQMWTGMLRREASLQP